MVFPIICGLGLNGVGQQGVERGEKSMHKFALGRQETGSTARVLAR